MGTWAWGNSVSAPRFYTEQTLQAGAEVRLEAGPSRHIGSALRLQEGAIITLFNGQGGEFQATITASTRKLVSVMVDDYREVECESPLAVHLGIAISRGDRMDWVVQKATELGATEISPLLSERTEVKLHGERADKKIRHWQQIAISACEQCGRNRLPLINPLTRLDQWSQQVDSPCKLVLQPGQSPGLSTLQCPASLALLVGPEGGLSDQEINCAMESGFTTLSLGPRILRTETAPLAALAVVQHQWGDL
jgi:16S rRNA (uracil1498-N3)-methyltransferase